MNRWTMGLVALLAFGLAGCASGPGNGCDECDTAALTPQNGSAAAAASGGQKANQAPFSGESGARIDPQTTVGRGTGNTSASSADTEHRETASGGAQNLGVVVPTQASASASGGVSVAVAEAAKTVASYRAALQLALMPGPDGTVNMQAVEFLSAQLAKSQETLAAAQAGSRVTHTTHNRFDNATINQFGVSSSSTDGRPDSEAVGRVAAAAAETAGVVSPFEKSSVPAAPEGSPPAGPADDPMAPGGGS